MINKVLNFLIGFLSFMIVISLALVIIFSFIGYDVTIKLNGATTVEKDIIRCHMTLRGCYALMPDAKRESGIVLGYSYKDDDFDASIKVGDKVKIEEEIDLYVISYREYNVRIEKNDVDYLEKDNVSCKAYNVNTTCKLKLPDFNKIGYQNGGYSKIQNLPVKTASEYYPFVESEISEDLVLYPRYTDMRDSGINKIYPNSINDTYNINGSFVEFDKSLSQETINKYKGYLEELKNKAPYLFVGQKINILSSSSFQNVWGQYATGGIILGICYGSSIMGHPLSRSVDVFWYSKYSDVDNYRTLVHELSHAFDMYYGYAMNNKVPDIVDEKEASRQGGSFDEVLNKMYGTTRISSQQDILALYNKYKNQRFNRPIDYQGYAYTKNLEFVAEAFSWYYMKYSVSLGTYKDSYFPDELKSTLEKYICIANNGYNKNGC